MICKSRMAVPSQEYRPPNSFLPYCEDWLEEEDEYDELLLEDVDDEEEYEVELEELVRDDEPELVDGTLLGWTLLPLMSIPKSYQEPSGAL